MDKDQLIDEGKRRNRREIPKVISFTVHGQPIAQPRHRHSPTGSYIRADHAVHAYKQEIALAARHVCGEPLDCPVRLVLEFVINRPKAMYAKKYPVCRIWHTVKPDLDNLQKSVKDALKNIAWLDDSQVCQVEAFKAYASQEEGPSTTIAIFKV